MIQRVMPLLMLFSAVSISQEKMVQPKFGEDNQLLRPAGYREWMFVGSSLGMGYTEGQANANRPANFHNIYVQPEAYKEFAATGRFPDKTTLVMEVLAPGANASINKQGQF